MITEEMLRAAAARSNELFVQAAALDYDPAQAYEPSDLFEKKIKRLFRRAKHPYLYQTMRRVAAIFLAAILAASVYLAVDTEARAAFLGWIKETYEAYFVYRFEDNSTAESALPILRPTWLPQGYTEHIVNDTADTITVIYANDAGEMLTFRYSQNPKQADWFIDSTNTIQSNAIINGNQADVFISTNPSVSSAILWTRPDHTAFYISGFLSENDLIKVAESIQEK